MKKLVIATVLSLTALASFAQTAAPPKEFGWTEIATNDNRAKIYSKSVSIDKNNRGDVIVVGVGRAFDSVTNRSEVNKWYVTISDCDAEVGMLTVLDTNGKFVNDIPFAFNQGSVGAAVAEALCGVYKRYANENKASKGKAV
jgi:hypothetical protein